MQDDISINESRIVTHCRFLLFLGISIYGKPGFSNYYHNRQKVRVALRTTAVVVRPQQSVESVQGPPFFPQITVLPLTFFPLAK
jgi:hypothetical protein